MERISHTPLEENAFDTGDAQTTDGSNISGYKFTDEPSAKTKTFHV